MVIRRAPTQSSAVSEDPEVVALSPRFPVRSSVSTVVSDVRIGSAVGAIDASEVGVGLEDCEVVVVLGPGVGVDFVVLVFVDPEFVLVVGGELVLELVFELVLVFVLVLVLELVFVLVFEVLFDEVFPESVLPEELSELLSSLFCGGAGVGVGVAAALTVIDVPCTLWRIFVESENARACESFWL